jgi:Raf kinase inhibitor-like YbhB/YbcL family protein
MINADRKRGLAPIARSSGKTLDKPSWFSNNPAQELPEVRSKLDRKHLGTEGTQMESRFLASLLFVISLGSITMLLGHNDAAAKPLPVALATADGLNMRAVLQANDGNQGFTVTSTTFENNGFIPASMVFSGQLGSVCTGANQSPELSWTPAHRGTRAYAVVLFDVTASFTHWGIYNIPPTTTELPENAGISGSTSGQQVLNDAGNFGYSGPCPPPDIVPNGNHVYVVTVYALDRELHLPFPSPDFPPTGSALFRAMIGHVVDSTSIRGIFRCTDASACS